MKTKAGYHKWAKRPVYGLSTKILRRVLGKKELESLIDKYMQAKKEMLLEALEIEMGIKN